jgi:hypothetical protein
MFATAIESGSEASGMSVRWNVAVALAAEGPASAAPRSAARAHLLRRRASMVTADRNRTLTFVPVL